MENEEKVSNETINELLGSFDGTYTAPQDGVDATPDVRDTLSGLIKDPSKIDALTPIDAKMLREEVNKTFCGGMFDYMMPNSAYSRTGTKYEGADESGNFDDKTMLKQFAQDMAWVNAGMRGVDDLYKLLNKDYGAGLGISGEEYGGLTAAEKADKILKAKALPNVDALTAEFDTWMNSWSTAQKQTTTKKLVGYTIGGYGGPGSVSPVMEDVPSNEYLLAMRGVFDYGVDDIEPVDKQGRHIGAQAGLGVATVDGKTYSLVMEDEKGNRLVHPYYKAEDGSTLTAHVKGRDAGAYDYYKFSQYNEKNGVHAEAVRKAMSKTGASSIDELAEKVWMSHGRIMEVDGDRFYSRRNGDKYVLEVGDGGKTEYQLRLVGMYQDKYDNAKNAMNSILVREIFNSNPDVLKWYQRYVATAKDNLLGRFDRRGDWEQVLNDFMEEFRPYAKEDSELDVFGIERRDHYMKTFQQLIDVLGMTDHREGFGYLGSAWTDWASGLGNTGLQFVNSFYNMFADGISFYMHLSDADNTFYDRFKNWAREDMKVATATQIYDQGTLTGLVGGEAAQLLAFSYVMKAGTAARLLNYAGRGINATGRAAKVVGLTKAGQKIKSFGQTVVDASRKIGGGTKTVAGGFRRIEVPANGKVPKGAFRVGEEWFMPETKKVSVGNFMQEANAKADKIDAEIKAALDQIQQKRATLGEMAGKIGVDDATIDKIYGEIDSLEKIAAKEVGARYGQVSQWCLDLANEIPALVVAGGAMADAHKAMSYYRIGEGFAERDESGQVKKVNFDYEPLKIAEKYAMYDAAGNTAFMLHIPKILKDVIGGSKGSLKAQTAARGWYTQCMEAMNKGEFNRLNALIAMYENAPRRLFVNSIKGGAVGAGMAISSSVVQNAEDIALERYKNPDAVFSVSDYLLNEEQAVDVVKSFGRMAAGMGAVGAVGGTLREVLSGNLSRNWKMITSMKRFGDANMDLWAMCAGSAYKRGKQVVDFSNLDPNPEVAAKQIRNALMADEENYRQISTDTTDFIGRLVDAKADGEKIGGIRNEMVNKYGEEYARVMDGVLDYVRTSPELIERFATKYAEKKIVDDFGKQSDFDNFGMKEITKGLSKLLGIKIRRPKKMGDGQYMLNIDVGGKEGWLNLVYRSDDLDAKVRYENEDGSFTYSKGWAADVIDGLSGKDETYGSQYDEIRKDFNALNADEMKQLRDGVDVNGILSRSMQVLKESGGGAMGVFKVAEVVDNNGRKETRPVATMNSENDNLMISDFAHEAVHGIVDTLRNQGYFKSEDGSDAEDVLRRFYGKEGNDWEEDFVRDLLTGKMSERFADAGDEAFRKLFPQGGIMSKLADGVGRILKLPFAKGSGKPVRSPVETALDAKLEEARKALEEERIETAAEEIKIKDELPDDVVEKTPESTALVISRNPIPNSVMMKDVPPDQIDAKKRGLNASGFYYDSQHDMWVNEHSAPTLFHRAVNEAIATKVKTRNDVVNEAFEQFQKMQEDLAAAIKSEQDKGSPEEVVKQVREKFINERRGRIRALVSPEDFTKSERDKMGIVVNRNGEPLGVVVSEYDFINDGSQFHSYKDLPPGSEIVPYDHDLYGRWCVKGGISKALSAAHNCGSSSLINILNGKNNTGLSFAMFPSEKGHSRFGAFSVLVGRPTIDPKTKYPKTPEGRKQANYLYKRNVGTPDYVQFTQVKSGGNAHEKAVEAVNQFEDYIFHGNEPDFDIADTSLQGAKYLRATNVEQARKEGENALYSTSRKPHQFDMFADEKYIDIEGLLGIDDYWEAKLGRKLGQNEILAVVVPRFTDTQIENYSGVKTTELDEDAVRTASHKFGISEEEAVQRAREVFEKNPEFVKGFLKSGSGVKLIEQIEEIRRLCAERGIPVYEYNVENDNTARVAFETLGHMNGEGLDPRAQMMAQQKATGEVEGLRFGVVGSRGASRFFGDANNDVMSGIYSVIDEAYKAVDEGTRKGLKSHSNAELNKWLKESGKDKFGPFILHIGGADGDPMPRLEYAGKKPKIPYGFLDRAAQGEIFHLSDILGNAVRQDEVFNRAYPELMNTPIFFRNSKRAAEAGVKEPAWGDDNTFVLANEDGQIVVDRARWNDRLAPEQFGQAIVSLVQKTEGWQERIRQSDARVAEALAPTRQKKSNSDMAFRLTDSRFVLGDKAGRIVEDAVRKRLGDKFDEATMKSVSEAMLDAIRSCVKDFAGEAEARFLASRFGLPEEKLRDYSAAEKVFKDTLLAFGGGTTSAEQTKANVKYWEDVIIRSIDYALFGKTHGGVTKGRNATIRKEFQEAVANEVLDAIVRNISSGSRAARTSVEARLAGVGGIGERGTPSGGAEGRVAFDEGGVTLATESNVDRIDMNSPMSSTMTIMEGVNTIDAKWEKNKASVAAIVREELERVKKVVMADMSKAKAEQDRLMKKIRKLVDDNCTTSDVVVKDSMFNEALKMAQGGGRYRVVGARRTPKRLLTEATAARIAKARRDGHRDDDRTRAWLEREAARIGVVEADRAAFVAEVMNDASAVADAIVARSAPSQSASDTIRSAEEGVARREFVKQMLNGWRRGYSTGASGTDAEFRARAEADRIKTKMVKDARGMGLAELNSMLGGDIVRDIVGMREAYGDADGFAVALIKKFSDWMLNNDARFARMTTDEFENSAVARAELAQTVAAWLRETARQVGYGQVREWAMREAARLQKQPQTFGSIHMTVAKHAEHMADSIDRQNVDELLDSIDKQIDKFADGDKAVSVSVPNYDRKIAPRLQEYWKYVKKAMRMTEEAVEKESNRLNGILNMTEQQLLDLGTKGSGDLDAAESGIREREDAMMKLNALMRFGSMKYRNYADCMSLFNGQMANELAGQTQMHLVERERRLANDAKIRQAFIGELTAIRRAKKGDDFDALDNGSKGTNFLTFSVADLFKRMQLYLHEGTDAWNFVDEFRQQMSLGHIDRTVFVSQWEGRMRDAVQRIYGVNFERLIDDIMVKRPEYDRFSRSAWAIPENARTAEVWRNGKKKVVKLAEPPRGDTPTNLPNHLSKANLIYIYAACQQADMQVNNTVWGRDAKYMREIEAIIGSEGVKMAEWLTSAYSEIRKALDPISREISGMPVLSPDERYCPLSFMQEQVSNDERRFTSSPFPSFLTRRVTHDSLRLNEQCDAFRTFEDKIQDSGHYIGFAKIIDRMNTTLKHPKVQTAYAQLYGTKAKNDIYAQLADALNGGRKNSDTLLTGARNFVTATSLFGNIGSALKQLEGIGGWAVEMGMWQWIRGLVRNPATSREVRQGVRELIDAGLFLTRAEEGISEAMVSLMNSCDGIPSGPMSRTYNWYKRHGMDITKFVDKIASMSMAGQYYTGRKNWYIEQGLREEDAKRRALADTDYAIQTTQQSGRSEFLHSAQRGGTAGKMLTQFSGPAFVRWGIECASWHRAVVMGDRGAWGKLMSRMVALHLVCPAILSLAGVISMMMFKRDDQKMKDLIERTEKDIIVNCLTGPMSGWFIYGQILNAFAYETVLPNAKEPRAKVHFEAPVLSKLHSLQQATSKMFSDVIKAAPWDRFTEREQRKIAEDALRIFDLVIPVSRVRHPVKNAVKALED